MAAPTTFPIYSPPGSASFYTSASGQITPSGPIDTQNAFQGPWEETIQHLYIYYSRIPYVRMSKYDLTLSSVDATYYIYGSVANAHVIAIHNTTKEEGVYSTSSYTQPQKFQVQAQELDAFGNSYGTLTTSALGPQGAILTVSPYMSRKPWVEGTSTSTVESCYATNYFMVTPNGKGLLQWDQTNYNLENQGLYFNDFEKSCMQTDHAGSILSDSDLDLRATLPSFFQGGTYDPTKETTQEMIGGIELLCFLGVKLENLVSMPPNLESSIGIFGIEQFSVENAGVPSYNTSFHDYGVSG